MTNREISIPWFIVGLVVVMVTSVAAAGAEVPTRLTDVSVGTKDDATTVTVKTGGTPKYHATLIDPRRLVVDFEATQYEWRKAPLAGLAEPIKEIRGSQFRKGVARLVVQLSRPSRYVVEDRPDGIVILLGERGTAAVAPARVPAAMPKPVVTTPAAPAAPVVTASPAEAKPVVPAPAAEPTRVAASPARVAPAPTPVPAAKPEAPVAPAPAPMRIAQAPTTPPPPPAGTITPSNSRRLISLEFKDADVVNLLRILAAESARNIVVGEDVKGKMSISLRNVPWEQALDTVLETRGLQKLEKGNVLRIVTAEALTKEREAQARVLEAKIKSEAEARAKMAEAQFKEAEALQRKHAAEAAVREAEARGPLREETLRLSYADPNEVANTLIGILGLGGGSVQALKACGQEQSGGGATSTPTGPTPPPIAEPPFSQMYGGAQPQAGAAPAAAPSVSDATAKGLTIRSHCPTHTLFMRLYTADLERIKKLIRESFDIPLPQVKIEARMEILDRNALEQIGIMWGGGAAGRAGSLSLVGQGFQGQGNLGQTVAAAPGIVLPDGSLLLDRLAISPPGNLSAGAPGGQGNPGAILQSFLPVSASTGLPLGGNLINLPISALPNAGPLPAAGLAFGIIASKFNVNLMLQALAEQGKTRTLARPEIVTVENNRATMSLGEEIPYATVSSAGTQIQFKEALLKLEVTPTVIREGDVTKIKMLVIVENNSRGSVVNLGNSGNPPAINKRKAETQVLVREGERLVIGGVSTSTDTNTVRKVPLLGDVPVIGWLFKQKENFEQGRELAVFLTPSILRGPDGTAPRPPTTK
jgi:type IV pilus assembly protein PilQ